MATSIQNDELIWRRSLVMDGGFEIGGVSDPTANASNGGRMTATEAVSGAKNAIWPDAPQSELTAGSLAYRKVFIHVANAYDGSVQTAIETNGSDLQLIQPRVFIETWTPGDDGVTFFNGTQTDTQSTFTETNRFGAGYLDSNVSAAATTLDVVVEDDEDGNPLDIFKNGDVVRISTKATVEAAGFEEYLTLSAEPGAPAGNVVTLNFTGTPLENGYTAGEGTKIASVYTPSTVVSSVTGITPTSTAGVFDDKIYCPNLSAVEENWLLTMGSGGNYTVTGLTYVGLLPGGGNISSDYSPTNSDFSAPYFTIKGGSNWTGTWVSGDTVAFTTHPAAIPLWYRRAIPAASSSLSSNSVIVGITGQST